eukprot:IDg7464t1
MTASRCREKALADNGPTSLRLSLPLQLRVEDSIVNHNGPPSQEPSFTDSFVRLAAWYKMSLLTAIAVYG